MRIAAFPVLVCILKARDLAQTPLGGVAIRCAEEEASARAMLAVMACGGNPPWPGFSWRSSIAAMLKPKIQNTRMKNKLLTGSTILLLAAAAAMGAHASGNDLGDYYRANELSLDLFGTASLGKSSIQNISGATVDEDTEFGVGAGLSYFFTRNIGVGAEAYSENTTGSFIDSASANLIARFPLGQSGFAPYVFGGGGRQFDQDELWFCQLGAGMEYRFNHQIGIFLDARWVLPEETDYYGVARLGLRFAF